MAARQRFSPLDGQIPVLISSVVFILSVRIVYSCDVGDCWSKYSDAKQNLGVGIPGVPDQHRINCIALRTYSQCIHNITGCHGNIMFHSLKRMVVRHMDQYNCSEIGPVYTVSMARPHMQPAVCSYRGENKYRHCGLFGDPHLRTFDDEFQTCKVQGAWPLIDNDYITVQVTNDAVTYDTSATATSKLTVMIKSEAECGSRHFVTYQAQTDYLPSQFDDGREHFGEEKSVHITEVIPGKHVEIYVRYIDTTLLIRQVGRYFTFVVRMPEDIAYNSRSNIDDIALQLCVDGCPLRERINYKRFLARQKHGRLKPSGSGKSSSMTRDEAVEKCRAAAVQNFYFDSCVFDLLTTGNTNFTMAANVAMQDILRLHPDAKEMHSNRTNLDHYDILYSENVIKSGAPPRTLCLLALLCEVVFTHMFFT